MKHGFAFDGTNFVEERSRDVLVTPGNFAIGGGFKLDKFKYYRGPVPDEFVPSEGDLIVTMTDLSKASDTLGYSALVPKHSTVRFLHNQRIGKVEIIKQDLIDKKFLYWLLRTPAYRAEILAGATGTTVKHTAPRRIEAFRVLLPEQTEQRAIAHILGTLDDKIELNRRMNETLETMAQAVFKSWFVDFDPVHAKAEGRRPSGMDSETARLFPASFEKSSLGEIPKGWRHAPVSDVCEGLYDGPHATPPESESGAVFLGIKNFTPTSLDLTEVRHIAETDYPNWTKRVVPAHEDIVFTYEATLGFFALIPPGLRCCLGRRTALVRPRRNERNAHFLFHWFIAPPFQEFLRAHRHPGSTVERILLKEFPDYPVLMPPAALIARFEEVAAPIWARIHSNQAEASALRSLRDSLLPRLLSGELSVADAAHTAAATA
ncbi:MAG TPA: restriction endonuclease subunit S [Myxococcus sp.]|nr:restriction endonuclease subunit S [Myxococcus sp.]